MEVLMGIAAACSVGTLYLTWRIYKVVTGIGESAQQKPYNELMSRIVTDINLGMSR